MFRVCQEDVIQNYAVYTTPLHTINQTQRRWNTLGLMLVQRRRRWTNAKQTLGHNPSA